MQSSSVHGYVNRLRVVIEWTSSLLCPSKQGRNDFNDFHAQNFQLRYLGFSFFLPYTVYLKTILKAISLSTPDRLNLVLSTSTK